MNKYVVCLILAITLLFGLPLNALSSVTANDIMTIAEGIISWKKSDNGASPEEYLINNTYLENAGTTAGDWYPIGLGRLNITDNSAAYLAVIRDQIEKRYRQPEKLSAVKATEWHRITLAILSMGGDPTNFGTDENGKAIDLISDGTYNRGKTTSLGRQGINGWIWGLIALDSMRYEIPSDAYYTRDDIIIEILKQQLNDGGFALSGQSSDPDITAMAVQALSPYCNSEKDYTYVQKSTDKEMTKNVRAVIDEAISCLSNMQLNTGDYKSWGTENVESTAQVIIALCCINIDPLTDSRFIKDGCTLLDGILRYRMPDGGFIHSFTYDPDNPSSLPNRSNTMAGEQVLCAMAAIWRQQNGMRNLYDFRTEMDLSLKERIETLNKELSAVSEKTEREKAEALLSEFCLIPESERNYVKYYQNLYDAVKKYNINTDILNSNAGVSDKNDNNQKENVLTYFSKSDRETVDALPSELSTAYYVTVTTLLDKINFSEDFDEKDKYREKLNVAKSKIESIQNEIDQINNDIKDKLYPFEQISLKDKNAIDNIVERYSALSKYDKGKIEHWEDVIKAKTQTDNIQRAIVIGIFMMITVVILTSLLFLRIRKRIRKKEAEMEELSANYIDENDE